MLKFEQVISFELNVPDPWLLVRNTQGNSGEGHSRCISAFLTKLFLHIGQGT